MRHHLCFLCPQFAAWVDAVVFVFSLEDEISFQTVYNYFMRLSSYRNTAEVPMVLVGTQGACPTSDKHNVFCQDIISSIMELQMLHRLYSVFQHSLYTMKTSILSGIF